MESARVSIESLKSSKEGLLGGSLLTSSNNGNSENQSNTVEVEFNFGNVITPSYRSVPLLVTLRQSRDKKYFGEVKQTHTGSSGVSDTLTATMTRQNSSVGSFAQRPFTAIPEEMKLNSRDLVKEHVRYYMNEQRNVFGELTLMPSTLIFEPALDDPVTRQIGLLNCQFQCDLKDVLDVQVIEASEILGWWKTKNGSNTDSNRENGSSNNGNGSYEQYQASLSRELSRESSREVASPSPGVPGTSSSPSPTSRPRRHSMNYGPSSSHLNTGIMSPGAGAKNPMPHFAANVNTSPVQSPSKQLMDARLDRMDEDGLDRSLRFLQLTVLMPAPVSSGSRSGGGSGGSGGANELSVSNGEGNEGVAVSAGLASGQGGGSGSGALSSANGGGQVGKIVYFLINRQSVDLFYQKLDIWCAQARPSGSSVVRKMQHNNNILKPQPTLYERMSGQANLDDTKKAVPIFGSDSTSSTSQSLHKSSSSSSSNTTATSSGPSSTGSSSTGGGSSLGPPVHSGSSTVMDIVLPKLNLPSALITSEATLLKLAAALPTRYRHSDWTNLYSTERHGVSLTTFFNKTKRKGPTYLIIEDDAGFCFGAYISDSWEPQRSYYGTGECFLFTLYPSFNVYPWSQLNEYFIYSKEDTIALGGGSGKFALWLDKDLAQGSSAPCDTFLNSTLSYQEDFKPTVVEVWGFNDAMPKN